MQIYELSGLSCVDSDTGALRYQWQPPSRWHQLSVRHLDVNQCGDIAVAMQYQGKTRQHPPLIALLRPPCSSSSATASPGSELLSAPAAIQRQLRNYCGSVRWSTDGQSFAVSSPRGGLLTAWSGTTGSYLGAVRQADACGVAADPGGGFWVSDGCGQLLLQAFAAQHEGRSPIAPLHASHWDNHLRWWPGQVSVSCSSRGRPFDRPDRQSPDDGCARATHTPLAPQTG